MADEWTEFEDPPPFLNDGMYVSLNPYNQLFLNKKVYEAMNRPKAVKLFHSPNTYKIGLLPAEPLTSNAYDLKPKKNFGGHRILLMPFCRKHGIKYDGNTQFLDVNVQEDGMLTLNLKKTRPVRKPRRNKTRK